MEHSASSVVPAVAAVGDNGEVPSPAPACASGPAPLCGVLPAAAERAYASVHAVGTTLLPVAAAVHDDAATCFDRAMSHFMAGRRIKAEEMLLQGMDLLDLLKRSVLPGRGVSRELARIYDYLSRELAELSSFDNPGELLQIARNTMRALAVAWQSQIGPAERPS